MKRIFSHILNENSFILSELIKIKGLGLTSIKQLLKSLNLPTNLFVRYISEENLVKIQNLLIQFYQMLDRDLVYLQEKNVQRKIDSRSYQGWRHYKNMPCRGQRTRSNARTRKKLKYY